MTTKYLCPLHQIELVYDPEVDDHACVWCGYLCGEYEVVEVSP